MSCEYFPDQRKFKGNAQLDRDKTYFPFGKPGSGAPLTDSSTGKIKTNLNGKFLTDYYVSSLKKLICVNATMSSIQLFV